VLIEINVSRVWRPNITIEAQLEEGEQWQRKQSRCR